jgi:hypothetical protein
MAHSEEEGKAMFQTQQIGGPVAPGQQFMGQQIAGPAAYMPLTTTDPFGGMMQMIMPIMMMVLMMALVMPMMKGLTKER